MGLNLIDEGAVGRRAPHLINGGGGILWTQPEAPELLSPAGTITGAKDWQGLAHDRVRRLGIHARRRKEEPESL